MFVVRGEGPFADAVRRALEYAQSHGVDLSGVEVEVVPDPLIRDAGAYTDHLGGLRFRIRYNPRYASDKVLASHEAGHVAKWAWEYKKRGGTQYNPNVDEPLAEAFGAVIARLLYGWPVTFKGAPLNLTQVLPQRTAYITVTVDGKPIAVEVPEWGDYMSRYRAGILLSPYFYNVTNWAHVFGNFTAMPGDVIKTIHNAWRSGVVEVVPGWGAVWRTTPTWTWTPTNSNQTTDGKNQTQTTTTTTTGDETRNSVANTDVQKTSTSTTGGTQPVAVLAQPAADVPLPPSDVQPPKYFSSDISPGAAMPPEWGSYISGRRVLVVFRNWTTLDKETLKDVRKDHVVGAGVVSGDRLRFEGKIPVPRVVDPNAWIEIVDEKTGKVLARLRSDELYKLTSEGAPVTLYWSHVAAEEKWPGWERFVERAKELDEMLGTWRPSGAVAPPPGAKQPRDAAVSSDGTVSAVKAVNAPTEYVPPKVPDDVKRQFEDLLSDLKKLGEGVNLRNVGEVHKKFIQLRDKALEIARAYPQLIDTANEVVGRVGSAIKEVSNKLYEALAKAAGGSRGNMLYSYDPDTGAFHLTLYDDSMKVGIEDVVGYIKEDGTPVVVKRTHNMSEALTTYHKIKSELKSGVEPKPPRFTLEGKYDELAKLAGLKSFMKDDIHSITYSLKFDEDAGVFMFTPWEGPKAGWTFVGYIKDDGTPVVVKETYIDSEAETEYEKLVKERRGHTSGQNMQKNELNLMMQSIPTAVAGFLQTAGNAARGAAGFLANALKTGAGVALSVVGGGKPSPASGSEQQSDEQRFVTTTTSQTGSRPVYNRRRGLPSSSGAPGSSQPSSSGYRPANYLTSQHSESVRPPGGEQKKDEFVVKTSGGLIPPPVPAVETGEFVAAKPASPSSQPRSSGYKSRSRVVRISTPPSPSSTSASGGGSTHAPSLLGTVIGPAVRQTLLQSSPAFSVTNKSATSSSVGYRPADYLVSQQSSLSAPSVASPPAVRLSEPPQSSSTSRRRGRPVAVPI